MSLKRENGTPAGLAGATGMPALPVAEGLPSPSDGGRNAPAAPAIEVENTAAAADPAAPAIEAGKAAAVADPARTMLHMPVEIRSISLALLALLAALFALQWAESVVVPFLLGLMLSYALTPMVSWLARRGMPRPAGALLVVCALVACAGWGGWAMRDQASSFVDSLPEISQKLRLMMRNHRAMPGDTISKVQQAAAEISKAAEEGVVGGGQDPAGTAADRTVRGKRGTAPATLRKAEPASAEAPVRRPALDIRDYLWSGTMSLLLLLSQTSIVLLVALFLLASGNNFRRKMVKLAGPRLSQKKVTIEALDEVSAQIQLYLLVQLGTSVFVGFATWLAFRAFGLDNAGIWGVAAGVTNLIPYVGAIIIGAGSAVMGLVQFGAFDTALMIGASSFAIHALVGNLVTPWLTGRTSRMSPLIVFAAVLAFGWLWGPAGLILGVPILLVIKAVCDRVDALKPIGELLGD